MKSASFVQQNAATVFYCKAPEMFNQHEARRVFILWWTAPFEENPSVFSRCRFPLLQLKISVCSPSSEEAAHCCSLNETEEELEFVRWNETCVLVFFFLVYPHFLLPESSVFMSELLCVFSVSHLRLSQEVWAKKHSCKNNEKQVNVNTSNYRLVLQGPEELGGGVFQDKVDGDGNKPWRETVTTD